MAVTVNIYQESAVRYLGTYGAIHQSKSTVWKTKAIQMFIVLCSTDAAQFNSAFSGTLEQLLATGVQELPTGNGYFKLSTFSDDFSGGGFLRVYQPVNSINVSTFSSYGNGYKFLPSTVEWSGRWRAQPGAISAKSALLCIQLPDSSATSFYAQSYPLAMIDFDGTRTAAAGTDFYINWNANGAFNVTR
jgi:hypothetical protein